MKRKGQYLSLEQMSLFMISVVITILIYHSFSNLTEDVGGHVMEDQLKESVEVVKAGIYRTYVSYDNESEQTYKRIEADIPKEISGNMYKINIVGDDEEYITAYVEDGPVVRRRIGMITEDIDVGMSDDFMTGITSRKGKVVVELDGSEIVLGR